MARESKLVARPDLRTLVLSALGASLLGLAACSEDAVLPTGAEEPGARPEPIAAVRSLAPASVVVTTYGFDDFADSACDYDQTFPSPYQQLLVTGERRLAVCAGEIIFASSGGGVTTTRFTLPRPANEASIEVKGYNVKGERTFVGYGPDGAKVDEATLPAGESGWVTLTLEGDLRAVSITDHQDNSYWDDLTVSYVEKTSDATPPGISHSLSPASPDGQNGWYRSAVSLRWSVAEPESPATVATTGCVDQTIDTDQAATWYTCAASSEGGDASESRVSIKRDATPPTVAWKGNRGRYTIDETVQITCSASDLTSGVAGGCEGLEAPAYSLSAGETELTAEISDLAGNEAVSGTAFTVRATYSSLCTVIQQVVTVKGIGTAWCAQLRAIERKLERDDRHKDRVLSAFTRKLERGAGRWVSVEDAAMLARWVGTL